MDASWRSPTIQRFCCAIRGGRGRWGRTHSSVQATSYSVVAAFCSHYMPLFCDVALAVPLDMVFTYAIPPGMEPVVRGRGLAPCPQQRVSGIVVELHERPPQVKAQQIKKV